MEMAPVTRDRRFRTAGIGVVIGGVLVAGSAFLEFAVAALFVLTVGIVLVAAGDSADLVQLGVGIGSVGVIGLFEAFGYGLGLTPLAVAGIAVLFGLFDVVVGLTFGWLRARS